jgi:hypothetical protein
MKARILTRKSRWEGGSGGDASGCTALSVWQWEGECVSGNCAPAYPSSLNQIAAESRANLHFCSRRLATIIEN